MWVAQNGISTHYLLDKLKVHDLCFVTIGNKWKSLHEVDDGLFSNKAALVMEVYKLAICADRIVHACMNLLVFIGKDFRIVHNHLGG